MNRLAALVAALHLAGCTVNLGNASLGSSGRSWGDMESANINCRMDAEAAWNPGHDFASGMMALTIIGIWPALEWEKSVKRSTWQNCMRARGFDVTEPA